jgi:hypothetical protein
MTRPPGRRGGGGQRPRTSKPRTRKTSSAPSQSSGCAVVAVALITLPVLAAIAVVTR